MSYSQLTQHSSHLWISDSVTTEQEIINSLQNILCNNACKTCTICMQIAYKQHPWTTWLEPNESYSINQIDDIIIATQFKLDHNEKRFFIFTQAQELTSTCCNRLLKTIEEPHPGYHFIFMTHRPQDLLPTLKSRCFTQTFTTQSAGEQYHEIVQPFKELKLNNPVQFMRLIDKQSIKESATKEIIDLLFEHFCQKLKVTAQDSSKATETNQYLDILLILKRALLQLPVQGSSKIFWKNFYITFHQYLHS